jgi:hypothetical protein
MRAIGDVVRAADGLSPCRDQELVVESRRHQVGVTTPQSLYQGE